MEEEIARRLVGLNTVFYEQFADPFSASRDSPQPGYDNLLAYLPKGELDVLDAGCGNGRFGRFLIAKGLSIKYTGIDLSERLLSHIHDLPGRFLQRDLSTSGALDGLGDYDLIVCLSTLQHIPGRSNRELLLQDMCAHLQPSGRIILANWQFLSSPRQRRKIRPWSEAGLVSEQVEPGDFLLSWERGGFGIRYVAHLDVEATRKLAEAANLRIANQYYSDGREGDLNLYTILARH